MKATGIHHSLKDLSEEIGNCEKNLSRAIKVQDAQVKPNKKRSPVSIRSNKPKGQERAIGVSSRSCINLNKENNAQTVLELPSRFKNDQSKNLMCKEKIKNKRSSTEVQVLVQTRPLKRRPRSIQSSKAGPLLKEADEASLKWCDDGALPNSSSVTNNNPSWSHILQQQSHIKSVHSKDRKSFLKNKEAVLQYSSSDGLCSSELGSWIKNVPQRSNTGDRLSKENMNGDSQSLQKCNGHMAFFNPVRTLNFLVKELRGKVYKNCDDNMQRIVKDMEVALHSIPSEIHQFSCNSLTAKETEPNNIHSSTRKSSSSNSSEKYAAKASLIKPASQVEELGGNQSSNNEQQHIHTPNHRITASTLQSDLEINCKQLEEICGQMQDQCETFLKERQQAHKEAQKRALQLEAALVKNRQLTMYSADVRQEMLRMQEKAGLLQQDNDSLRNQLLKSQQGSQDSVGLSSKRMEEILQENGRLSTEIHLNKLEIDKMRVLLSSKDLEAARLKKDIVGISALVSKQLANLCTISKQRNCAIKLGSCKSFDHEGERNRTHPICSSPTSSIDSSLYHSWQLSDISDVAYTQKHEVDHAEENIASPSMPISFHELDSNSNKDKAHQKVYTISMNDTTEPAKLNPTANLNNKEHPAGLKADLQEMLFVLKTQAAEAVNVTLPSPPQDFTEIAQSMISHWTELSASESTLLNSSEDSHSD